MQKDCKYVNNCKALSDYCSGYSEECPKYLRFEKERATQEMHNAFRQTRILMEGQQ